jgi:uncharacterized protein YfbU (UPF0304 family)
VKFSPFERIVLIHQLEMISLLDPEQKADCERRIEILHSGFESEYDELMPLLSDGMPFEDGKFVRDVLFLFRVLENFYLENPDSEVSSQYGARFMGFDGNEETMHYALAKFIIEDLGEFQEQKERNPRFALNSHSPMLSTYAAMLAAWNRLGEREKYRLTEEMAAQVVAAG